MDLSYGKEYEEFRTQVRDFLAAHWPPDEGEADRAEGTHRFRQQAIEAGYLYRNIPSRYGGSEQEPDAVEAQILREEFSRVRAPMEIHGIGMMMLVPTLLERAEEWQKEKFVAPTVRGEIVWCQGYSEPGSGSDLASLQTRAEIVGNDWVINGQKIWTTNAQNADWMFCLCRTEPEAQKHAGISYLLIPMKQPGIEVSPLKTMNGSADFNQVFFTDVKTPADHIVGKRGEGWLVSRTTLKHERNSIGAAAQSVMMLQGLVEFAKQQKRNGRPAIEDRSVREKIATFYTQSRGVKMTGNRSLSALSQGKTPGPEASLGKLVAARVAQEMAAFAMELQGTAGAIGDHNEAPQAAEWQGRYLAIPGMRIAGGTDEILRNIIAERVLGLPPEARADKGIAFKDIPSGPPSK